MCGIIARVSTNENPIDTLEGVKFLEYRGYDSYGVLLSYNGVEKLDKNIGELPLKKLEQLKQIKSNIEIAHTRWATHGGVTKENAHPHFDKDKKFYVVMNGIIENYLDIKAQLRGKVEFVSQSDTEVIPQLFSVYFKNTGDNEKDLLECCKKIMPMLKGEFSFIVKYKNTILGYKNINPIIAGIKEGEFLMSSDMGYVQNHCDKYYTLNDCEIMICSLESEVKYTLYENYSQIKPNWLISKKSDLDSDNKYDTYMEKEIYEQKFIRNLIETDNLSSIKYLKNKITRGEKVILSAAGTSYHAAYIMHHMLLRHNIMSQIIIASELNNYVSSIEDSIIVVFSQSGETADLIHPLKNLRDENEIFTITNSPNSTLDRFASRSIHLNCGREIGVASTKAFVSQVFVSHLLEAELDKSNKLSNLDKYEAQFDKVISDNMKTIDTICSRFSKNSDFFFIGRDLFHPLALEGALKLKEISYIHAEGFAGGELKHGTLALIEKNVPVVVLGSSSDIISNAIEIKTRGGVIIGISSKENEAYEYHLKIPDYFEDIYSTILMQLIALKMTLLLGHNPDKPRNLAKSVTVK